VKSTEKFQITDNSTYHHSCALAGLTEPGEVGKVLALLRLKSLSLDYKAKLKSPCFFLQVHVDCLAFKKLQITQVL
jgi:hypothetical protein